MDSIEGAGRSGEGAGGWRDRHLVDFEIGWLAGQYDLGERTRWAGAATRKWLQLRVNAWLRGKPFDLAGVTPAYLAALDVAHCPITGSTLTHGTGAPTDASVDRVDNTAGYLVGNLAVMSALANGAKSDHGWRECAEFGRQVELGRLGHLDGLDARAWHRLASLASLATPLPHAEAALVPMLAAPPPGLRLVNPVQQLQWRLTEAFACAAVRPRVDQLRRMFPADVQPHAHALLTTLLARRLAARGQGLQEAVRAVWADALVLARWRRVALRLDAGVCGRIVGRLRSADHRGGLCIAIAPSPSHRVASGVRRGAGRPSESAGDPLQTGGSVDALHHVPGRAGAGRGVRLHPVLGPSGAEGAGQVTWERGRPQGGRQPRW